MRYNRFQNLPGYKLQQKNSARAELGKPWARLTAVSTAIAAVLIPLAVLYVGNRMVTAEKEAELRLKYLELSIGILREAPSESTAALRAWAIQVLVKNTPVELSKEVLLELEKNKLRATGWDASYTNYTNERDAKFSNPYTSPSTDYVTTECKGQDCPKLEPSTKPKQEKR
jgi:hypothetical protein